MFVTVRSFRNYGEMVPAGLIVEPSQIRRFKDKLREGKIVAITETNKQRYNDFISKRLHKAFNVDEAEKYKCPVIQEESDETGAEGTEGTEGTEGNTTEGQGVNTPVATAVTPVAARIVATAVSKEN